MSRVFISQARVDHIVLQRARSCCKKSTISRRIVATIVSDDAVARKVELDGIAERLAAKFAGVPNISPIAVTDLQLNGDSVVLVDVRTVDEYTVSQIPGSLTIEEFEAEQDKFLKQGTKVVAYCTVGYRSLQYAQKLQEKGFDAANLEGSILAWTHEGLPLVTRDGDEEIPSTKVHVFAEKWALHGDGYEPVTFKHGMVSYAGNTITSFFSKLFK